MDPIAPPASAAAHRRAAGLSLALVWAVSTSWYSLSHPAMGAMAAGGAAYAAVLAAVTLWLVRQPAGDDHLRATGETAPLWAWYVVTGTVLAWAFLYGFAFGGVYGGVQVPYLTPWIADLCRWRAAPGVDGTTLLNFLSFALIPMTVLLALSARRRELGICAPIPGTGLATVACLALPLAFVAWGFVQGTLTIFLLLTRLLHNFLSNGFSEEFMCRGLFLASLRSGLPTAWAIVVQGLLFAMIHLGGGLAEEAGDPVMAVAASVSLNLPMGLALGVIAARTGSLALPTAIHIAGHLMKDALQ